MLKLQTKPTFPFYDLDESAQEFAFNTWREKNKSQSFYGRHEVEELKERLNEIGISFLTFQYDIYGVVDFELQYMPNFKCHRYDAERLQMTGVRAAKEALKIYHKLCIVKPVFLKRAIYTFTENGPAWHDIFEYSDPRHNDICKACRQSELCKKMPLLGIDSYYGADFIEGLLASVKNNTADNITLKNHLDAAVFKVIAKIGEHFSEQLSWETFKDGADSYYLYYEDGSICTD